MERMLNDDITQKVQEAFESLDKSVQVILFTSQHDCEYCEATRQLLEEVTALSAKLELVTYDVDEQAELAKQFKINRTPGFVIAGKDLQALVIDYGIRFLGIPAGNEFTSLINDLVMVSSRATLLSDSTRTFLNGLTQPVLLQVFTTPT